MAGNRYLEYLKALESPFQKLARLEFLQPDESIAFVLDNKAPTAGYNATHDSRAFIQSGTLSVSLQNGTRRKATVQLSNEDGSYEYAVNHLWFGQKIRLSMGLILQDGTEFYLPQGVFYIKDPQNVYNPTQRVVTLPLVDKWSYLNGDLLGNLERSYEIPVDTNIFDAIVTVLHQSKYDWGVATDSAQMIDSTTPVFTDYYNGKTYTVPTEGGGTRTVNMTDTGYTITTTKSGGTWAKILLELNNQFTGWIGYDQTGALRVDASQNDISDADKPILWTFSPSEVTLFGITETSKNSDVYNDVRIVGEGIDGFEIEGRAQNYDLSSNTNINLIGRRTYVEEKAEYWNNTQCQDMAEYLLKRKTVLEKSISISCQQMFHLVENGVVAIWRTDKEGSPLERHLIQSFTIPIGETGAMTINATSVNDYPQITIS